MQPELETESEEVVLQVVELADRIKQSITQNQVSS